MKRRLLIKVAVVMVMVYSQIAWSQAEGELESRSGHFIAGGSAGYMVEPDMAGIQVGMDYFITNDIAVGPLFIGGISGEDSLWGLSGQVKYSARLAETEIVRPYGHIGIGFINLNLESYHEGKSETTFLFPVGGGFEFELTDELTLDINALFIISNIRPVGLFCGVRYLF